MAYRWPGNVRELENTIRQLIILRDPHYVARDLESKASRNSRVAVSEPAAEVADFKPYPVPGDEPVLERVTKAKQRAEAEAILATLNSTRWNRKQAAAILKIDYKALLYKMKKLGIEDGIAPIPFAPAEDHFQAVGAAQPR